MADSDIIKTIPAIPDIEPGTNADALRAIKEAIEILAGSQSTLKTVVRFENLIALNILDEDFEKA